MNKVYICIPVHNRINLTLCCLRSIFKQSYLNFHVVISDAGSTDGTKEIIEKLFTEKVTVLSIDSSNFWTGGINECIKHVLSFADNQDFIYTLNNDTELASDCISTSVLFINQHSDSIVGSLNLFFNERNRIEPSSSIQKNLYMFYYTKRHFRFGELIPVSAKPFYESDFLSGKGVLYPVAVFRHDNLFNDMSLPHYHADGEFVLRLKRMGFKPILLMSSHLFSHVEETGIGTIDKSLSTFIKSFLTLKSANHLKSLYHFSRIVYGHKWPLFLVPKLFILVGGFIRRQF